MPLLIMSLFLAKSRTQSCHYKSCDIEFKRRGFEWVIWLWIIYYRSFEWEVQG